MEEKDIAVVGAEYVGLSYALVFALKGYKVLVYNINISNFIQEKLRNLEKFKFQSSNKDFLEGNKVNRYFRYISIFRITRFAKDES